MSLLLRTLFVWLLLLALPYQGFASATMMLCAPASASSAAGTAGHDHAAMLAAQAGQYPQHAVQQDLQQDLQQDHQHKPGTSSHDSVKCGAGACCAGTVLPPSLALSLPALANESATIPFRPDFLPAVHLAHPERPPQDPRA